MSAKLAAGPLAALSGVVVGALLGERLGPAPARGAMLAGLAGLLAALVVRSQLRLLVAMLAFALLGTASMQRALDGLARSPLAGAVHAREEVVISGALADDPGGGRFGVDVLVRARTIVRGRHARSAGGRTVLATGNAEVSSRLRVLSSGDRVELVGRLEPLEGWSQRFRWRHAVARLATTELRAFSPPGSPLASVANSARAAVLRGNGVLPATERALMAGFLLGDTRQLPSSVTHDFRLAGLSHLLAVSGANVAFVLAMVGPVLTRLGLRARFVAGALVLVVFGTMTRWEPSVLRAVAMAGCSMLGMLLGRPASGLRVLALAVAVLVLADPFLLHAVGFLLSCGASAGIACLGRGLTGRLRGPRWLREGLGVTLAAQIGVAPVLLPVFGSIPLVSLPANLLAVPAAAPLTIWGLVAGSVGGVLRPWWPGAVVVLQAPTVALARYVEGVASVGARLPLALDGRSVWGVVALGCIVAAEVRLRRLRGDAPVPPR